MTSPNCPCPLGCACVFLAKDATGIADGAQGKQVVEQGVAGAHPPGPLARPSATAELPEVVFRNSENNLVLQKTTRSWCSEAK